MRVRHLLFWLLCTCCGERGLAQLALPVPRNIQAAIDKGTRTASGRPGPHYWQNRADYSIAVHFDPRTRLVSGRETIAYSNNSPDSLRELLFKLYPNLYEKGAARNTAVKPEDLTDGVAISNVAIDGQPVAGAPKGARGTDMGLRAPAFGKGQTIHVSLDFAYTLNKTSHLRTGQIDSGAFFVAYFFPRIAVYDDIDGWNRNPYLGDLEFYNDFCHFDVEVTVPGDYLVWGTGDLVNRQEVLSPEVNRRIDQASTTDGIVTIVDTGELARGLVIHQADSHAALDSHAASDSNTWKFSANDVTDFVFAVSDHYIWKSSSLVVDPATGRRTRVDAVFNPLHKDYYEVIDFARKTVEAMSYRFPSWPYPYPHETVFDGLDQMEYPMMVNDNPLENRAEAIELTDHEIFHTMFPFYMGINETKYAWMDEGWASIGEWLISPMIDTTVFDEYGVGAYADGGGKENDLPIITLSTQENGADYFLNAYAKPAFGYLYVKDLLGDSLFRKGLHRYIEVWHGRHPGPLDFFGSFNAGCGRNLNWFWKRWFYDGGYPDLAIKGYSHNYGTFLVILNKGGKPIPIDLTIDYADGTTQKIHRSVGVWEKGNKEVLIPLKAINIKQIRLGSTYTPDSYPADNVWPR